MSERCADPNCGLRLVPSQIEAGQIFCTLHQIRWETEERRQNVRDQLAQCEDVEALKTWLFEHVVSIAQERVR